MIATYHSGQASVRVKRAVVLALLVSAVAAGKVHAQAPSASTQQLEDLRRQVEQLQRQLEVLQQQQEATEQNAASTQVPAQTPAHAPVDNANAGPGIKAGPLTVTFGGFAELTSIYRNRNEVADVSTNFNTGMPYPNLPQYHVSEFRETARQSRVSILTQGSQDGDASAEAYVEVDFQSSAPTANSAESNSYNPRLRQYYATYSRKDADYYLLAGQSFSLATLFNKGITPRTERIPFTVDGQYVPGFNWTRNPQLRFVKDFDKKLALGLSLESPQANVFNGPTLPADTVSQLPGGFLFAPNVNYSVDPAPDLIIKAAWDPGWGHYELYGLGRAFRSRHGHENDTIYGGGVGAGMILPLGSQFDLQLSGLFGNGIGRYGSAQLPDVTLRPDGKFSAVTAYQALLGLAYRPTDRWNIYAYAGIEHADTEHFNAVVGGVTTPFGYGNPLYNNSGCGIEGNPAATCAANTERVEQAALGAWWKYYQGALGNFQVGLQGSYTNRKAFTGIGGDPDTNMIVGMLSFRFYPYQK